MPQLVMAITRDEVDVKCELRGSKDNAIACSADGARYSIKRVSTR
jgi:hypothetical protein